MFSVENARDVFGRVENPLALLEGLFLHSPVGVQLYSPEGRSLFVNQAFLDIFGVPPPPGYSVLRDEIAVRTGVDGIIRAAFQGNADVLPVTWYDPGELEHVKVRGGRRAAIETRLVPIQGERGDVRYVVFFFRDVTSEQLLQEKNQEAARLLLEANSLIDGLLNGSKAMIYARDLDGRFLFANRQYYQVTGRPAGSIVGKVQREIHPTPIADVLRRNDRQVLETGQHQEFEEVVQHADGTHHTYISLKFPLVGPGGRPYGVCGISTDITETRRLEAELARARKMEALGILAGGVAHEFNNLLGIILLHADALFGQLGTGSPALRDVENIRGSIDRASRLVRQLLAFGRRLPVDQRPVSLNGVVTDLTYLIGKLAGEGTTLKLELDPDPCFVLADPARLEQLLLNLCLNARDAVAGAGTIRVRTGRETLRPDEPGLRLPVAPGPVCFFEVEDDGSGMTAETLDRAFEPFYTTKAPGEGTGLGLSTVFGIAQECGGNIRLASRHGEGCRLRVYFPECAPATREELATEERRSPIAQPGPTLAILVEDEKLLRDITARHLRGNGIEVLEAASGPEARALFEAHPGVGLLLTDVIMPGQSGPALVRELAGAGLLDGVAVLFISGYSSDELARFGVEGIPVLEKPFSEQSLLEKVGEALAAASRTRSPRPVPRGPTPSSLTD